MKRRNLIISGMVVLTVLSVYFARTGLPGGVPKVTTPQAVVTSAQAAEPKGSMPGMPAEKPKGPASAAQEKKTVETPPSRSLPRNSSL